MKLTVNNLGPITIPTEIDFSKNLTIIAGPNSTGKSYITYSLWKMLDFSTLLIHANSSKNHGELLHYSNQTLEDIATDFFNGGYMNKFFSKEVIKGIIHDILLTHESLLNTYIMSEQEINALFKDDSTVDAEVTISIDIKIDNLVENILNILDITNDLIEIDLIKGVAGLKFAFREDNETPIGKYEFISEFFRFFNALVITNFIIFNMKSIELATSERASAFLFWRSEADKSDQIRFSNDDENNPSALYTEPVLRNIKFARDLGTFDKKESYITKEHPHIITELERLMGGILRYADTKGVYFNKFKDGTLELDSTTPALPFHMLSSSIRSLTHIYFYLKCKIRKNSIFIIDEPEAYLHPQAQTKMAHIIAMLTNAGIQVIITTHSEFLIREIANLTMLNELEDSQQKKFISQYNYNEKALIKRTDINTYYYTDHTFKITDEDDFGIWIDTIDDTISTQGEIFDKLENAMIGIE